MILSEIIAEADLLVPNGVAVADKVAALNGFNQDFFNVVKIPRTLSFAPIKHQDSYTLSSDVRLKNIDLVHAGLIKYKELTPGTPNPIQNTYTFDDSTYTLTLRPAPYANLQGLVRYHRIGTTTFTSNSLETIPDAPTEYHFTFVWALASFLANTQDDAIKASNYENQYKSAWNVAAQNYAKGGQA